MAEYVYDPAGNLLQIRRYAVDPGALVSIAMIRPTKGPEAATVELFGQGFAANPADNRCASTGSWRRSRRRRPPASGPRSRVGP